MPKDPTPPSRRSTRVTKAPQVPQPKPKPKPKPKAPAPLPKAPKQTTKKSTGAPAPEVAIGSRSAVTATLPPHTGISGKEHTDYRQLVGTQHNNFCTKCYNGGDLYPCSYCLRVVCNQCVEMPDNIAPHTKYTCLNCFMFDKETGKRKDPIPYTGLSTSETPLVVKGGATQRQLLPTLDSTPLLMISFRLEGMEANGHPPIAAFHELFHWLPGDLVMVDIPFNLDTDHIDDFEEKMEELISRLETGDLQRFKRFAVFLMSHSEPTRGDLHFIPNSEGASPAKKVLGVLFPPKLRDILQNRGCNNALTILTCGPAVTQAKSREAFRELVTSGCFAFIVGFDQPNLQPSILNRFVMDLLLNWFIRSRKPVATFRDHSSVGIHTSVYIFERTGVIIKYTWSHVGTKPFGEIVPLQCPECLCIGAWSGPKPKVEHGQLAAVSIDCKNPTCSYTIDVKEPIDRSLTKINSGSRGPFEQSERGDWYSSIV